MPCHDLMCGREGEAKVNGTTWVILGVFVALILFKLHSGRRSQEELTVIRQAVADGGLLLDVRSPREFNAGHLDGARNIPVGELQRRLEDLGSKDRPVVVYCASGARSRTASRLLRASGFHEVHDLGPWRNWE